VIDADIFGQIPPAAVIASLRVVARSDSFLGLLTDPRKIVVPPVRRPSIVVLQGGRTAGAVAPDKFRQPPRRVETNRRRCPAPLTETPGGGVSVAIRFHWDWVGGFHSDAANASS